MIVCDICQGRNKYCKDWKIRPKSKECALMLMMLEIKTDLHDIGNALLKENQEEEPPADVDAIECLACEHKWTEWGICRDGDVIEYCPDCESYRLIVVCPTCKDKVEYSDSEWAVHGQTKPCPYCKDTGRVAKRQEGPK